MIFRTGYGYIEQTAFFFQRLRRVSRHTAGEQLFFHPYHKDILKFQPFGGMYGHQGYLCIVSVLVRILVGKQGDFRKEITQCDIGVTLFLPLGAEVSHTVCKFFDILLATEVFWRIVLANIIDDTGLTDYLRTEFVSILFGNALYKSGYQVAKALQLARCPFVDIHSISQWFAEYGPQAYIVVSGGGSDFAYRRIAYSACRIVDDTFEGFFIIRIDCQTEIGDYIFYFLTLIERQSAVNAIRHAAFAHGFLEDAALRVGTIEYGKVGISVILLPAQFGYLVDYNIALFHITVCLIHPDSLSPLLFRKDFLANLPLILFYQTVGCRDNRLGGTIILFQLKNFRTRIYLCKIQNVINIRPPERINTLRIITHHTDVLMLFRQLKHNTVLGKVGVLILIHQNIAKLRLIAGKHIRMVAEKQESIKQ